MCIRLASRNQHVVQAAKMLTSYLLKTCWDTLMEKYESETKELLRRYNEEECSLFDERQGHVQEVESIPRRLQVNMSFMSFTSPVIGQLLCSSTRL